MWITNFVPSFPRNSRTEAPIQRPANFGHRSGNGTQRVAPAVSPFNHDDLIGGFAQAKESLPKNPSDTVYKNIKRGFLTESPEKKSGSKAWIVTNSGERFVENGLKEE